MSMRARSNGNGRDSSYLTLENELAEQVVIGAILRDPMLFHTQRNRIRPELFTNPLHQRIVTITHELAAMGRDLTIPALLSRLPGDEVSMSNGHVSPEGYLAALFGSEDQDALGDLADLEEIEARRGLFLLGQAAMQNARVDDGRTWSDRLKDTIRAVQGVDERLSATMGLQTLGEAAQGALRATADAYRLDRLPGYGTGIRALDQRIGRIMPGDLVTILAPSGAGKTALLTGVMLDALKPSLDNTRTESGLFIEMEMQAADIARRVMAESAGVEVQKQEEGTVNQSEYEALDASAKATAQIPLRIVTGRQRLTQIIHHARTMSRLHGLTLMGVDHVKLIERENRRDNALDTISEAVKGLKGLAQELGIPIILCAQCTREYAKRGDARDLRPRLSDIFGGGIIEECSDIIIGLSNPSALLPGMEPPREAGKEHDQWSELVRQWEGKAEIADLKRRRGRKSGWGRISFDGARTRFSDLD